MSPSRTRCIVPCKLLWNNQLCWNIYWIFCSDRSWICSCLFAAGFFTFSYFHIFKERMHPHKMQINLLLLNWSRWKAPSIAINSHTKTHFLCVILTKCVFEKPGGDPALGDIIRHGIFADPAEDTQSWLSVFPWINNPGLCSMQYQGHQHIPWSPRDVSNTCIKPFIVETGSRG